MPASGLYRLIDAKKRWINPKVADGGRVYDFSEKFRCAACAFLMEKFDEFAYSQSKDVITSLEFERLMNAAGPTAGKLLRPSDGKHPHT